MNPLTLLLWLKDNWRLVVFLLLVAALGAQSYRLQGAQGERDLLQLAQTERLRRDAQTALANLRNKERTDEDYVAAAGRAAGARVRSEPTARIEPTTAAVTQGGDDGARCVSGGQLDQLLAEFSRQHAAGLSALLADFSLRHGAGLSAVAPLAEGVAAAYRACRAFSLNLSQQKDAPDEAGETAVAVGGEHGNLPRP